MSTTTKNACPSAEMSAEDHALLLSAISERRPRKVLELGVSAGGTTALLLDSLEKDAVLYSVDICEKYYRDPSRDTGYIAAAHHDPGRHGKWVRHLGKDIAECIEDIGGGIDFVVLDTLHALPGEVLSFLAFLPYTGSKFALFIHDLSLHLSCKERFLTTQEALNGYEKNAHSNILLMGALHGHSKTYSKEAMPNSGLAVVERDAMIRNIFPVMNILSLQWCSVPAVDALIKTRDIVQRFYSEENLRIFDIAVKYNLSVME